MKNVISFILLLLALSGVLAAQTTTTYYANSGTVSSFNAVTGYLEGGGAFHSPWGMGGGCYFGGCANWGFHNYPFSYILPDGATASFNNFAGTADFSNASDVKIQGAASGVDSAGNSVSVAVEWEWNAICHAGRGGGCIKKFLTGTLRVTQ